MKKLLFVRNIVVLVVGLLTTTQTSATAGTVPGVVYVDIMPSSTKDFILRVTPVEDADHYRIVLNNDLWEGWEKILEGDITTHQREQDEISVGCWISFGLLGFTTVDVTLTKDGALIAEDVVVYYVKELTQEEDYDNYVLLMAHEGHVSLTIPPKTIGSHIVVAVAEENIIPPSTETPKSFAVTPPVLVVHTSSDLAAGIVGLQVEGKSFAGVGYRPRVRWVPEPRELQLLNHKVAPRGIYTDYTGTGAYAPVPGSRILLPLVLK